MLMVAACAAEPGILDGFDRTEAEIEGRALTLLVADTSTQRNQGFRGVDALPEGIDGMLFVFETPRPAPFVMSDTLIPLDIWWFDDEGILIGSAAMTPCHSDPCPTYASPGLVRWALETPTGEIELAAGDRLVVDHDG